jgi:hypothetical protein
MEATMTGRCGRALALASLSLIACSSGSNNPATSQSDDGGGGADVVTGTATDGGGGGSDATQVVTQTVGAAGGTVTAPGVTLTIPAGALPADTQIVVTTGAASVPTGYAAVSPVFSFAPAGTTFAMPVNVQITLTGSGAGASVFLSNGSGGYDPVPTTTSTATSLTASITHLGDAFAGEDRRDAAAPSSDAGTPADTGTASTDTGVASDTGSAIDTGTTTDAGAANDSGADAVTGQADSSPEDTGSADAGAADTGASEAAAPVDGGTEGGAPDGATSDAGTPGIFVTIDGASIVTPFIYNVRVSLLQAWWQIAADDTPSGAHSTLSLIVPTNMGTLNNCQGASFPEITYVHYTTSDGGAGSPYTTNVTAGAACNISETTTATSTGQHAIGTFSGTLVTANGNPPTHALTGGTYDIIVP